MEAEAVPVRSLPRCTCSGENLVSFDDNLQVLALDEDELVTKV